MPTSNSNIPSFQGIRLFSSKNPASKEGYTSKNNMPLKKTQQMQVRPSEERNIPRSFAAEKRQEHEDEKSTPPMISAKKTRLVRYCSRITSSSMSKLGYAAHQIHAVKKTRGEYSPAKIKVPRPAGVLLFSRII
jgi:hypothetical protein